MSDIENEIPEGEETELVQDPLQTLKARADQMGIKYHPSISLDKLRAKVSAKLNDQPDPDEVVETKPAEVNAPVVANAPMHTPEQTLAMKRKAIKDNAHKLVRVNIACNNPAKREWEGEIFTTGNQATGTLTKMVPFNVDWHVPQMILNMIRDRECQIFVSRNINVNGIPKKIREAKMIREFNVQELEPLTKEELDELARRQAMANSIG